MLSIALIPLHMKARHFQKELCSHERQKRYHQMKSRAQRSSFTQLHTPPHGTRRATHAHKRNATGDILHVRATTSPSLSHVNARHGISPSRSSCKHALCSDLEIPIHSLLRQCSTVAVTVDSLTRLVKLARLNACVHSADDTPISSSTALSSLDLPLAAKLSESVLEDLGDSSSDDLLAEWLADQRSTYHEHHGAAPTKRTRRASTYIDIASKSRPEVPSAPTQVPRARKTFSVMSFLGSDRTRRKASKGSKPKKSVGKRLKSFAKGAKAAVVALRGKKREANVRSTSRRRTMVWV